MILTAVFPSTEIQRNKSKTKNSDSVNKNQKETTDAFAKLLEVEKQKLKTC